MSAINSQIQMSIDNFETTLVPGSVKSIMASIKATFVTEVEDEKLKIKGAGGSSDLWKVPPQAIKVLPGFNVRLPGPKLEAHIEWLADSIYTEGFFQHRPIAALVLEVDGVVDLYAFDGHCRLEGANRAINRGADISLLPVVVQDGRHCNIDDLYVQMHRLNNGMVLAPFELGILCKRLAVNGHPDQVIATRMGIKPTYVDGLLKLVNAPKPLVDSVLSEELAASEAIAMIRQLGYGKVVQELEYRRARALAEIVSKEPQTVDVPGAQKTEPTDADAKPVRPRITARHASNAHVKKTVAKHAKAMFDVACNLKRDPAYEALSVENRLALEELLAHLEIAKKADAMPLVDNESSAPELDQAAA